MKVAFDTTNILGRGAVKDTCSLLADGMVKLLRALAAVEKSTDREWAKARGYGRYLASSVKGEAAIDWSDKRARTALLALIVDDADWLLELLELSRQAQEELPEDSEERQRIVAAAELLGQSEPQECGKFGNIIHYLGCQTTTGEKGEVEKTGVRGLLPVEVAASWQRRVEVRFSHFDGYSPSRHRSFLPSSFLCPGVRALCSIVE